MKSIIAIAAAAVLVGGVATAVLFGRSDGDLKLSAFPDRTPHSMALPNSKMGIDQTIFELSTDRLNPANASTDYKNGETGKDNFRPNGTMKDRLVFYKELPNQPKQLKWRASVAEDGITYLDDAWFWTDGSRMRVGQRQADGTYVYDTYYPGGKVVNEHTVLAVDGSALYRRVQTDRGVLLFIGQKTKDGVEEKQFAANGNPTRYVLRSMFQSHTIDYYGDTGVPKMDIASDSYSIVVIDYAPNGQPKLKHVIKYGTMEVTVYENGVSKYVQTWTRTNPAEAQKGAESIWQLYSVAAVDSSESEVWKLWFYAGNEKYVGKTIPNFKYESLDGLPLDQSHSVKVSNYTEAGCLWLEYWAKAKYGEETKRIKYDQDRGCSTIALPLDMMKPLPWTSPTKKVPDPEPHEP